MNSKSENGSQRNSALENLVQQNEDALSAIEYQEYEPQVFAITVRQRTEDFNLLKQAASFQPTLYRRIEALATRKELQEYVSQILDIEARYMERTAGNLTAANRETVTNLQDSVSQAGRSQETFISDSSKLLRETVNDIRSTAENLRRQLIRIMVTTAVGSALLSVLASAVYLRLAL